MPKRDVFIVMLDTEPTDEKVSRGWLLSLHPMTTKDALRRMSWRREGHMAGDPDLHMILAKAFVIAPRWATGTDRASVKKWASWEAFKASSRFNADYKMIEPEPN